MEVARSLRRPRALATLDAALRSQTCTCDGLSAAAKAQVGRRGIVMMRELVAIARPQAESPMESEARLVMLDGGLPEPELQYEIGDRDGLLWRVDFAWPDRNWPSNTTGSIGTVPRKRYDGTDRREPHSRKSAGGCYRSSATMSGVTPR